METKIGQITHFYDRISVAVLRLTDRLQIGDRVRIRGHTTDFVQDVASIEIEHQKQDSVGPQDEAALKVIESVRKGDSLYKIIAEP